MLRSNVLLSALIVYLASPQAHAAEDTNAVLAQIQAATDEAALAFEGYSYKKAQAKLEQALALAATAGLKHDPRLADVHVMLGVTAVAGQNNLYRGLHAFTYALRLNPKVALPQKLATPQLEEMLNRARQTVKAVGQPPIIQLARARQGEESGMAQAAAAKSVASGLAHTSIDSAKRGFPIPVKVETGIDIQAAGVLLYFRTAGRVEYTSVPMSKSQDVFRAAIPVEATAGRYIHYYLEAHDQRGRLAASFGSARSPSVIIIE